MPSIDDTVRDLAADLPSAQRAAVAELPWRLGLTPDRDGRWEDFVRIASNRDLPGFAAEVIGQRPSEPEAFRRAHHCAAAWGLIADRVADGQVGRSEDLAALRAHFRRRWEDELARGFGDRRRARCALGRALTAWRRGLRAERRGRDAPDACVKAYAGSILDRLQWITTSACCAVDAAGLPEPAMALEQGYLCFLVALQLRDDALDAAEDAALYGSSVPDRLELPGEAFHVAAPVLVRVAAQHLEDYGYLRLGVLLRGFALDVDRPVASSRPQQAAMAAMPLISAALDGLGLDGALYRS